MTGNTWTSGVSRLVKLDFTPPFYFQLFAVKNDTTKKLLSDGALLNAGYAITGSTPTTFLAHLSVTAPAELNTYHVELSINDSHFGSPLVATITDGKADFPSVPLTQCPTPNTTNTIYGRVVMSTPDDIISNNVEKIQADSIAPTFSFTQPTLGAIVNYNRDSDADPDEASGDGNGVVPKDAFIPRVVAANPDDFYDKSSLVGRTATISATDGNGQPVALGGETMTTFSESGVASFSKVRLPNTRSVTGNLLNLSVSVSDFVGNEAVRSGGAPQIRVDDDLPGDVTTLTACAGSASGTGALELEPAACNTLCGNDYAKCDRRAGKVLLSWTVPNADAVAGTGGAPASYEVHWVEKQRTGEITSPCTDAISKPNSPASASVVLSAPPTGSNPQTAVISGLDVNLNTDYCFFVRAVDAMGNKSRTNFAAVGSTAKTERSVSLGHALIESSLGGAVSLGSNVNQLRVGDLNGDGLADFVVSDKMGSSGKGRVYIYYGQAAFGAAPTAADAGWQAHGQRLEGEAAGDQFGSSFAVGDLNGDGIDDLAVGANGADPGSMLGEGRVYVYFGVHLSGIPSTPSLIFKPTAGADGDRGQGFGQHVEILDFDKNTNGTGGRNCKALAMSTLYTITGSIYLVKGRADWSALGSAHGTIQTQADLVITRATDYNPGSPDDIWEMLGQFMSKGDFNKDGYEDLLISQIDYNGSDDRVWIVWGNSGGSTLVLGANSYSMKIDSPTAGDDDWSYTLFGLPPTSAGLRSEALISYWSAGKLYYYRDLTTPSISSLLVPFTIESGSDRPWAGDGGDFNGDGKNDVVLSYRNNVNVYWGSTDGLSLDSKLQLNNGSGSGQFTLGSGYYKAIGGHFNTDDRPDLFLVNMTTNSVSIVY